MKLSMALTLDGLVRSLRRMAHDLADDADHGYAARRISEETEGLERRPTPAKVNHDDRTSR